MFDSDGGFFDRKIMTTMIFSLIFHIGIFYFQTKKTESRVLKRIDNVEFIDETSAPRKREEIKPPSKSLFQAIKDKITQKEEQVKKPDEERISKIVKSLPPVPGISKEKGIDLSDKELDRSQAKGIDLDKFKEMEGPEDGVSEVIRVTSEGEQTGSNDILDKPAIKLNEDKKLPEDSKVGLFSSEGSGGSIDLEKVKTEEIKRDRKVFEKEREKDVNIKTVTAEEKTTIAITGPLSEREILRKPLPEYPEWAARKGLTAIISVKIQVSPDGEVKDNAYVVRTSGYGSWDRMVMNKLKNWRFARIPEEGNRIVQSGIVTIKFVLK